MKKTYSTLILIVLVLILIWLYGVSIVSLGVPRNPIIKTSTSTPTSRSVAVELPASWGDLGEKMVATGVIDREKLEVLYTQRGGLTDAEKQFLEGHNKKGNIIVTQENSNFILNLLWALGLGNKNAILEQGQMSNPQFGGAGRFASTGGWSLAKGNAMEHYSAHPFIMLSPEQQELVERTSATIYRPCCDNPAVFPDCNHGMAMLGLLELLASQGVSEEQIYEAALAMNRFWFAGQYEMIERYLAFKGLVAEEVSPKEILGKEYSSGSGFGRIVNELKGAPQGGGSCSV